MSDSQQTPSNLYLRVIILKSGRFKFSQFPSLSLNNEYPHAPLTEKTQLKIIKLYREKKNISFILYQTKV